MNTPDAKKLLREAGLPMTPNRGLVLESISSSDRPLRAREILEEVRATHAMNKVTLYRILDLLVDKNVIFRHSSGDRAFRYCLTASGNRASHCHFYCKRCGGMECLSSQNIPIDFNALRESFPMRVEDVEIRLDGICDACQRSDRTQAPKAGASSFSG